MAKAISPKVERHRARQLLRQNLVGIPEDGSATATIVEEDSEEVSMDLQFDEDLIGKPLK